MQRGGGTYTLLSSCLQVPFAFCEALICEKHSQQVTAPKCAATSDTKLRFPQAENVFRANALDHKSENINLGDLYCKSTVFLSGWYTMCRPDLFTGYCELWYLFQCTCSTTDLEFLHLHYTQVGPLGS